MKNWHIIVLLFSFVTSMAFSCGSQNPNAKTNKRVNIIHDGIKRHYLIHTPPDKFMDQKLPLLFVIHGGGGTAKGMPRFTDGAFNDIADRDGVIVIYPNAIDKNWNDGRKYDVTAAKQNIDDVGYINAIIEDVAKEYPVDRDKIFSCGISNGGFMSNRLACDLSSTFKAVGIVTAQMSVDYLDKCMAENSISVLIMNGTEDPLVPYDGGQVKVLNKERGNIISTKDFFHFWKERNHCQSLVSKERLPDLDPDDGCTIDLFKYNNCRGNSKVHLYRINGGGHTWPGGKKYLGEGLIGRVCYDINGYEEIWNFFKSLD